jgi:hypothetical protein
MTRLTRASPSPVPFGFVVKNGERWSRGKLLSIADLRERESLGDGDDEGSIGNGADQRGEALGVRVHEMVTNLEPALLGALRVADDGSYHAAPPDSVEEPFGDGRPDGVGDSIQRRQPSKVGLVVQGNDAIDSEGLGGTLLTLSDANPHLRAPLLCREDSTPPDAPERAGHEDGLGGPGSKSLLRELRPGEGDEGEGRGVEQAQALGHIGPRLVVRDDAFGVGARPRLRLRDLAEFQLINAPKPTSTAAFMTCSPPFPIPSLLQDRQMSARLALERLAGAPWGRLFERSTSTSFRDLASRRRARLAASIILPAICARIRTS